MTTQARKVKRWYEILQAVQDDWQPAAEDIIERNYQAADLFVPQSEFDDSATMLDIVLHFQQPGMAGMHRNLKLFDMLHLCMNIREHGVTRFLAFDFLLVPRERIRDFECLKAPQMQIFADPNMPDLCMIQLARSFQKSFTRAVRS